MEYRTMDNIGAKTSLLGFGCMRFPTNADGSINEELAFDMLDRAYHAGVNYFDTAYPYHGGKSEPVTGKALDRYPRDSYYLATKLPIWEVKTLEDVDRIFHEQLERLHKDYVDFYLIHALNKDRWELAFSNIVRSFAVRVSFVILDSLSMMIMKFSGRSSPLITGISARYSLTIWIRTRRLP